MSFSDAVIRIADIFEQQAFQRLPEVVGRVLDELTLPQSVLEDAKFVESIDREIRARQFGLPAPGFEPSSEYSDIPANPSPLPVYSSKMAKRARTDALTGGTGDVNPEYVHFSTDVAGNSAADKMVQASFTFPIQNFQNSSQTYVPIIELLGASLEIDSETKLREKIGIANANYTWFCARLSMGGADNPGAEDLRNPKSQRTFFERVIQSGSASAPTYGDLSYLTGPGSNASGVFHQDMTDKNGHGLLLYGNVVTLAMVCHGQAWPSTTERVNVTITYRVKNVSLQQYLAGQAALGGTLAIN